MSVIWAAVVRHKALLKEIGLDTLKDASQTPPDSSRHCPFHKKLNKN